MARIFISYKRVDKEKVFKIKDQIESALGEKCWIDLDGIESDAQFKNVIIKAINECEIVLFMYSKAHSKIVDFEKDWTMRELNFAAKKNKRIVFVNLDGSPLADAFEFDFGIKQQVNGKSKNALSHLMNDLRLWLGTNSQLSPMSPKSKKNLKSWVLEDESFLTSIIIILSGFFIVFCISYVIGNKTARFDAVEQQTAEDLYQMGENYYYGRNAYPKDYTEAVKWYRKAAEQGDASGQCYLGLMYENGRGVTQDYTEAVKWYRKAAEQGNAYGQNHLGWMYQKGYGITQDYTEAVKWYRKAAEQGDAEGQCNLGYMYRHGYGVTQDYTEAVKWYRKAAEQGNASGQYNLGWMYYHGQGVSEDKKQAKKYFQQAANQGDQYAKTFLEEHY